MNSELLNERGAVEKELEASRLARPAPAHVNQRQPIPKVIQTSNLHDSKMDEESIRRRKNKTSAGKCTCIILLMVFILFFGFVIGALFNYFCEYEYESVFEEKIHITSKYIPNTLLHSVKVNFKSKNFTLEHRLVPKQDGQPFTYKKKSGFKEFKRIHFHMRKTNSSENILVKLHKYLRNAMDSLDHLLNYKTKENQEIRIFEKQRFEFNMSKVNRRLLKQDNEDVQCYNVVVTNRFDRKLTTGEVETCLDMGSESWYGGHESHDQPYWPINTQVFDYAPYETGYVADGDGTMLERYWISTKGVAIFIGDEVPLFVSKTQNKLCLRSSNMSTPYVFTPVYRQEDFSYTLCNGPDIKTLQMFMINNYLGKPESTPDKLMMQYPIWTTWNVFFRDINASMVLDFAQKIVANNYSRSQLEIDDKWEKNYGDLEFDKDFGDSSALVDSLHKLGFRVTLWVHPFCNIDSYNFVDGAYRGIWVRDPSGQLPAFTEWWDGNTSAIIDTTNPDTIQYYNEKLDTLKKNYNIDSFKFDAGEVLYLPTQFSLFNKNLSVSAYTQNYVKMAAAQSNFIEVQTAYRLQKLGIFFRILDRDSRWDIHNGLQSLIPATFHFGIIGYPFALPDIIGGNSGMDKSMKEMYIRWVELTAFLPAMQFGVPPWFFDDVSCLVA